MCTSGPSPGSSLAIELSIRHVMPSADMGDAAARKKCVVKCPVLEEFSLSCFDTERANNIKLSSNIGTESVPW